jgi:hypothetical protein
VDLAQLASTAPAAHSAFRGKLAMANTFRRSRPDFQAPAREAVLDMISLVAKLVFAHGQTTERTVEIAERLGHALGIPAKVLPDWDKVGERQGQLRENAYRWE